MEKALFSASRCIGKLVTVGSHQVMLKRITKPKQRLFYPRPAYCCDTAVWSKAVDDGVQAIIFEDYDLGALVGVRATDFSNRAFHINRGHGPQLGLPVTEWNYIARLKTTEEREKTVVKNAVELWLNKEPKESIMQLSFLQGGLLAI